MNSTVGPNFKVVCPKKKKKSTYGFYKQCIEPIKNAECAKNTRRGPYPNMHYMFKVWKIWSLLFGLNPSSAKVCTM